MASVKVFDRFIENLEKTAQLGREVAELGDLVGKHEAQALEALLQRMKPVMPYIDGPITTREEWVSSDNPRDRQSFYYKEPGIVLVNNFESTVRDPHGRLSYSGYKIAYTRSGKLVQLDRRGSWSDGAQASYWSSDAHELDISPEFAERHIQECVRSIATSLERAAVQQKQKKEELRGRLEVLREVAKLLEEPPAPSSGSSSLSTTPKKGTQTGS